MYCHAPVNTIDCSIYMSLKQHDMAINWLTLRSSADLGHFRTLQDISGHSSELVSFDAWKSHETQVCGTQRAGRLVGREKIRQIGRSRCSSAPRAQVDILHSIRPRTGNQWRGLSKGFAWSRLRLPRTRQAALFCTLCRRFSLFQGEPPAKSCSSPALTDRKTKPASSSRQQIGGA